MESCHRNDSDDSDNDVHDDDGDELEAESHFTP